MNTKYYVRKSRGKSWAVDELYLLSGGYYIKQDTRYFDTEEEAKDFKLRKTEK